MRRFAFAVFLLIVAAAIGTTVILLARPSAEAIPPGATITVNTTADANTRDNKLSLREAILLANGMAPDALDEGECNQIIGGIYGPPCSVFGPIGDPFADTIVFDAGVFDPGTIDLTSALPSLSTGNDTVDGSGADVILDGGGKAIACLDIVASSNNTIKGLEIYDCYTGVDIREGAQGNTVGGTTEGERNIISDHYYYGVRIYGTGTDDNVVKGNYLGTNASGTAALPNRVNGMYIAVGARNNTVEDNLISGNGQRGVHIRASGTNDNTIRGNFIGTNASATGALPNEGPGVYIAEGAQDNTIGGTSASEANIIAFNDGDGVQVDGASTTGNTIRRNSIHSNGEKGIENTNGGNEELEPPTITGFGSVEGTSCSNCTIDIYSDGDDQGELYEGSSTADGSGDWSFSGSPEGPYVTATATDSDGNTSQFSDAVAVPSPPPTPTLTPTPTPSPTPAATATPTPTVSQMRNCPQAGKWAIAVWEGADGVQTTEALAACGEEAVDMAYALEPCTGQWLRWFRDRPEISNLSALESGQGFFALGSPTASPSATSLPVSTAGSGQMRGCPLWNRWSIAVWDGADGTDVYEALATCDEWWHGYVGMAYELDPDTQNWRRWFGSQPAISNLSELSSMQGVIAFGAQPPGLTSDGTNGVIVPVLMHYLERYFMDVPDKTEIDLAAKAILDEAPESHEFFSRVLDNYKAIPEEARCGPFDKETVELTSLPTDSLNLDLVRDRLKQLDPGFAFISVKPLAAPSELTAHSVASVDRLEYGIDLSWQDNSDDEEGFLIYRSFLPWGGPAGELELVASIGPNVTTFFDPLSEPADLNDQYCYQVAAFRTSATSLPEQEPERLESRSETACSCYGAIIGESCVEDEDGDGIPDAQDNCKFVPGSITAQGCPDLDLDGVPDIAVGEVDQCPERREDTSAYYDGGPAPTQKGCPVKFRLSWMGMNVLNNSAVYAYPSYLFPDEGSNFNEAGTEVGNDCGPGEEPYLAFTWTNGMNEEGDVNAGSAPWCCGEEVDVEVGDDYEPDGDDCGEQHPAALGQLQASGLTVWPGLGDEWAYIDSRNGLTINVALFERDFKVEMTPQQKADQVASLFKFGESIFGLISGCAEGVEFGCLAGIGKALKGAIDAIFGLGEEPKPVEVEDPDDYMGSHFWDISHSEALDKTSENGAYGFAMGPSVPYPHSEYDPGYVIVCVDEEGHPDPYNTGCQFKYYVTREMLVRPYFCLYREGTEETALEESCPPPDTPDARASYEMVFPW
jgi:CSLREA domain-containing protein